MKTILSGVKAWTRGEIRNSTADWNQNDPNADSYVKNRTHYDSRYTTLFTCSFDGDLTKKEEILDLGNYGLVKISNDVPSIDDIIGANYIVKVGDETYPRVVTSDLIVQDVFGGYMVDEIFIVLTEDIAEDGFVATKGIWSYVEFNDNVAMVYVSELNYRITRGQLKKLDRKFLDLPTNLATQDDIEDLWDYAEDAYYLADQKMNRNYPSGGGSFSMNRKQGEVIGSYSSTIGYRCSAQGSYSEASGLETKATGEAQKVGGKYNLEEAPYIQKIKEATFTISYSSANPIFYAYVASDFTFDPITGLFTLVNPTYQVVGTSVFIHEVGYISRSITSRSIYKGYRGWSGSSTIYMDTYEYYGEKNPNLSAYIVGNGASDTERSNAHTLDWEGNAWYSGDVYVGSTSGTNKDEGSKKLATEEYVDELVAASIENNEQVQPDWNQNDENAVDYIKNKPFYTRYGRVALVDNLTKENYENGIYPVCNFVPGQSYDVVCDDILYENIICIEDDGWNVILGDTFYIDDDGGNGLYIEGFEEDWSTLSIFTTQETVKKIDEKYLPNVRKVLKLYTCYSENADDGRAGGTPALAPDKILRVGFADWEDYVTVEALANADDIVIFEGQTKVGVPANITFCTHFDDYYNTSTEYAIITFYSEHEGKIRTMWSREGGLTEYLATQDYVDAEISKISAISLTEDLTDSEKQQVRDNIGAGTSNFSGSYNDLTDKPDLGQQELITPEDIDIICGQSIELASEVLL